MKIVEILEGKSETFNPPSLSTGDTILVGKWKNRKAEIKGFKKDENNQPVLKTTKGDQKLFKPRISKLMKESPLADYQPLGDFNKPGPFTGVDKKLVPHQVNQLKAAKFLENTPYDFRLFFSNLPGTGKYSEHGPMKPTDVQTVFKEQAQQILTNSQDAITIVFVGNKGDAKVMLTPWMMAHRLGHAIQAGVRKQKTDGSWPDAEQYFFRTVNAMLENYYGKAATGFYANRMQSDLTPEYNALFNALGTQRSSRTNKIKRPYEFMYELFAQYLKDGRITLNPLPTNLGYGRQAWGNPSKYMNLKPEYRDEDTRQSEALALGDSLSEYFAEVLRACVGNIYVM